MIYDSSVILKCVNGNRYACNIIFSDNNCIIPPTTNKEISWKPRLKNTQTLEMIKDHCKIFTYNDYPFNDIDVQMHINEFIDNLKREFYYGKNKRGRNARQFNTKLRYFKRNCIGSKNPSHLFNDYKIFKEANILAEKGFSDILVSADRSQTNIGCQEIYGEIMENLPEPFTEEKKVECIFYKDVSKIPSLESACIMKS